jgi:hypothetical protein
MQSETFAPATKIVPADASFSVTHIANFLLFLRALMPTEAEWLTRKSRIDTRLKQRGWKLAQFSPGLNLNQLDKVAVEEFPTANGPADYGLFVGGRLLGIVRGQKGGRKSPKCASTGKTLRRRHFSIGFPCSPRPARPDKSCMTPERNACSRRRDCGQHCSLNRWIQTAFSIPKTQSAFDRRAQ